MHRKERKQSAIAYMSPERRSLLAVPTGERQAVSTSIVLSQRPRSCGSIGLLLQIPFDEHALSVDAVRMHNQGIILALPRRGQI